MEKFFNLKSIAVIGDSKYKNELGYPIFETFPQEKQNEN
jgi:acyl-CoA synthetase (NDP forming)